MNIMKQQAIVIDIIVFCIAMVIIVGCNRGDVRITPVLEGQPAPHRGVNFGPDSIVEPNQPCKVTGVVVDLPNFDPNDIFGDEIQ